MNCSTFAEIEIPLWVDLCDGTTDIDAPAEVVAWLKARLSEQDLVNIEQAGIAAIEKDRQDSEPYDHRYDTPSYYGQSAGYLESPI